MFLSDAVWVVNMRRKRFLEHESNSVSLYVCINNNNLNCCCSVLLLIKLTNYKEGLLLMILFN